MSQTRWQSVEEIATNIIVGYSINFAANLLLFPHFGWEISVQQNLLLGAFYTGIAFVRGYGLRRWFNWRHRIRKKSRNNECCNSSFQEIKNYGNNDSTK